MAERPGVLFRFELLDALEQLDPTDAGQLFIAAMRYGKDGTAPKFQSPILSVVWSFVKSAVDHDAESYDGKILQRQHAVYCREAKRRGETPMDFDTWKSSSDIDRCHSITSDIHNQDHIQDQYHNHSHNQDQDHTHGDSAAQPPSALHFTPPTVEEVAVYVRERGSAVDPQGFLDYYAARGWKIGNTPMQDWKAACRSAESWERWKKPVRPVQAVQVSPESYQQDMARLRRILEADEKRKDGEDNGKE